VSGASHSPGDGSHRTIECVPAEPEPTRERGSWPLLRRPGDLRRELGARRGREGIDDAERALAWPAGFCASPEDRHALLVLLCLSTLTPRRLLGLAAMEGSAASCLEAVRRGRDASVRDQELARSIDPRDMARRLERGGAGLVAVHDPGYPPELLDLFDPPAGLLVRGHPLGLLEPRVAIVGARNCSAAGSEIAASLARALARAGVTVVSGGARGIDAAAHRGALDAGGTTLAVLGSGIDVDYPRGNRVLLAEIAAEGAVVSEYPPGIPAEPFRFPARNRVVAALSVGVVVVEGRTGSGSMITADHALDLGREVFAVPGPITSELGEVPLALIRDGATLLRGPDDLLGDLGLSLPAPGGARSRARGRGGPPAAHLSPGESDRDAGSPPQDLSQVESVVWGALQAPTPPDHIAARTGIGLPEVMSALFQLEVRRLVRAVGGRYERRLGHERG
jgi:DNA processing protein